MNQMSNLDAMFDAACEHIEENACHTDPILMVEQLTLGLYEPLASLLKAELLRWVRDEFQHTIH